MNIRVLRKLAWFALPLVTLCVSCGEDDDTSWKDQLVELEGRIAANEASVTSINKSLEAGEYVTSVKRSETEDKLVVTTNKGNTFDIAIAPQSTEIEVVPVLDGTTLTIKTTCNGEACPDETVDLASIDSDVVIPEYTLKLNDEGKYELLKDGASEGDAIEIPDSPSIDEILAQIPADATDLAVNPTVDGDYEIVFTNAEGVAETFKIDLEPFPAISLKAGEDVGSLTLTVGDEKTDVEVKLPDHVEAYTLLADNDSFWTLTVVDKDGEPQSVNLPKSPIAITGLELQAEYVDPKGAPLEVVKSSYLLWDTYAIAMKDGKPVLNTASKVVDNIGKDAEYEFDIPGDKTFKLPVTDLAPGVTVKLNDNNSQKLQTQVLLGAYSQSQYRVTPSGVTLDVEKVGAIIEARMATVAASETPVTVKDVFSVDAKATAYKDGILTVKHKIVSEKPWDYVKTLNVFDFWRTDWYDGNLSTGQKSLVATLQINNPAAGENTDVAKFVYSEEYGLVKENLGKPYIVFKKEARNNKNTKDPVNVWPEELDYSRNYTKYLPADYVASVKNEDRKVVTGFPTEDALTYLDDAREEETNLDASQRYFTGVTADVVIDCGVGCDLVQDVFGVQVRGNNSVGTFLSDYGFDLENDVEWDFYIVNGGDDKGTEENTPQVHHFELNDGILKHTQQNSSIFNWVDVLAVLKDTEGNIMDHLVVRVISVPNRSPQAEIDFDNLGLRVMACDGHKDNKIRTTVQSGGETINVYETPAQGVHYIYNHEDIDILQSDFDEDWGKPSEVTIKNFAYYDKKGTDEVDDDELIRVAEGTFELPWFPEDAGNSTFTNEVIASANKWKKTNAKGETTQPNSTGTIKDIVFLELNTDTDPTDITPYNIHDVRLLFAENVVFDVDIDGDGVNDKPEVTYEFTNDNSFRKIYATQAFDDYTRIAPAVYRKAAYPESKDPLDFDGDLQYGNVSGEYHFAYRNRISDIFVKDECLEDKNETTWKFTVESKYVDANGNTQTVSFPWEEFITNDNATDANPSELSFMYTNYWLDDVDFDITKSTTNATQEKKAVNHTVYGMYNVTGKDADDNPVDQYYFMPNPANGFYDGVLGTFDATASIYDVKVYATHKASNQKYLVDGGDVSFQFIDPFKSISMDQSYTYFTEQGGNELDLAGSVNVVDFNNQVVLRAIDKTVELNENGRYPIDVWASVVPYNMEKINAGPQNGLAWTERFFDFSEALSTVKEPAGNLRDPEDLADIVKGMYSANGPISISIVKDHSSYSTEVKSLIDAGDIYMNGTILTKKSAATGLPEGSVVYVHVTIDHRWSQSWGKLCSEPIAITLVQHGTN